MGSANERCCWYNVTLSLIGWTHTQKDSWNGNRIIYNTSDELSQVDGAGQVRPVTWAHNSAPTNIAHIQGRHRHPDPLCTTPSGTDRRESQNLGMRQSNDQTALKFFRQLDKNAAEKYGTFFVPIRNTESLWETQSNEYRCCFHLSWLRPRIDSSHDSHPSTVTGLATRMQQNQPGYWFHHNKNTAIMDTGGGGRDNTSCTCEIFVRLREPSWNEWQWLEFSYWWGTIIEVPVITTRVTCPIIVY